MRKSALLLLIAIAQFLAIPAFASCPTIVARDRNPLWAAPVKIAGVPNLYRVAANFYRSAQPEPQGFYELARRCGIHTVISLRAFHPDDQSSLRRRNIRGFDFPMFAWLIWPDTVKSALEQLRQSVRAGPTLLHCQHGADRTGLVTALYRIVYQGWTKEAAIDELENGQYGFHDIWVDIPLYIRFTDVGALKRELAVR